MIENIKGVEMNQFTYSVIKKYIPSFETEIFYQDTIELDTSRYANPREAFWFWCSKEAKLYNKKRTTQEKKDFYFYVVEVLNIKGEEE
jgi:hypothetical protein|tara:strand:+ start:1716 stop:1979 length:264 start_codon:yes stop_codon:yes gene_type:complete